MKKKIQKTNGGKRCQSLSPPASFLFQMGQPGTFTSQCQKYAFILRDALLIPGICLNEMSCV